MRSIEQYEEQSFIKADEPAEATSEDNEDTEEALKELDGDKCERLFEVDFSLKLQPVGGKAIAVPLAKCRVRGTIVSKVLVLAMKSRRNLQIIDAILDLPDPKAKEAASGEVQAIRRGKQKRA